LTICRRFSTMGGGAWPPGFNQEISETWQVRVQPTTDWTWTHSIYYLWPNFGLQRKHSLHFNRVFVWHSHIISPCKIVCGIGTLHVKMLVSCVKFFHMWD
jgi:hypothetical protein